MLDNRLSACAAYVSGRGSVADIGTDHGFLPCHLVSEGICNRAIAADINEGPLSSARENIKKAGLEDKIITVLSDGLDKVPTEGVSDVIIAGMGGGLIAQILQKAGDFYSANFILQPMTKIEYLRAWLWDNSFEILSETACKDGFYYTVMQVKHTGVKRVYTELDTYIGMMKADTDDERDFLMRQAKALRIKGEGLAKSSERRGEGDKYLALADSIIAYINE